MPADQAREVIERALGTHAPLQAAHALLLFTRPFGSAQVPPMPAEQAREVIQRELGAPIEAVFEWIDLETPLGSASISQVWVCAAFWCLVPAVFEWIGLEMPLGRASISEVLVSPSFDPLGSAGAGGSRHPCLRLSMHTSPALR